MIAMLCVSFAAMALDAGHYAPNSVLSAGKWRKIKVSGEGLHLVSNADLKAMGFSDASKVNVYGTGGRMVREALTADMADDLPLVPSLRTSRGILFFGVGNVTWSRDGLSSHTMNPYCAESYYFLSDREIESGSVGDEESTRQGAGGGEIRGVAKAEKGEELLTQGLVRLLHEQDLQAPSQYGRMMLGEDFRTNRSQTFNFSIPGYEPDHRSMVTVGFGANVSNGSSTVSLAVNGSDPQTIRIPGVSGEQFISTAQGSQEVGPVTNGKTSVKIDFTSTGALFVARLDYIKVTYWRTLDLGQTGELHFSDVYDGRDGVEISGVDENTVVWEIDAAGSTHEVEILREGDKGYFVPSKGYGEFVAFNPQKAGSSVTRAGNVANQDIHGMDIPDMVIVAFKEYAAAAEKLAKLHEEHDGLKVVVLTPEVIYNEFSGGHADVSAFRKMLKMWYDRGGEGSIRYCLLMGRGAYDSRGVSSGIRALGYKPLPMWESPTGVTEVDAFATDDIIGMLDDVTEEEFDINGAQMRVAVGRLPVKTVAEANDMAAKIEKYVKNTVYGAWRNKVMLIADDADNAIHFNQSESIYARLMQKAPNYTYDRLYLDAYPLEYTSVGKAYPKAKEKLFRNWNEGVAFTNYIGHASTSSWTHEHLLTWSDIISFSNTNLTFLYAATCLFGRWDGDLVSGAEVLLLNPDAGMIGIITPCRTVYMTQNGELNLNMANWLLTSDPDGEGAMRVGDVFIKGKNAMRDANKLRYNLMADPALRIPRPSNVVEIEKINEIELAVAEDFPEIPALSKMRLSGKVTNPDGSINSDFNGTLVIDLYDAEKVIETNGNGDTGVKSLYNDRKSRLASVSTKVSGGEWSATVNVPLEIDNNYSPARIVAYAWDETGKEAHGSTENLYVYGISEDVDDTEGPAIDSFYLNYPGFTEGETVHANPVVHARFHDESGINLSESGVGHRMSLTLDDDVIYSDVASYYTPDPETEGGGYIAYPLSDLKAGEHTITLSVYDNANNSTKASLSFNVGTAKDPVIRHLGTDVNPASTSVVFDLAVDMPNTKVSCMLEVFDLMGRKVWSSSQNISTDLEGGMQTRWNLCDGAGRRVPRGIYLYRATVESPQGMYSSQTKKLAVTAQ